MSTDKRAYMQTYMPTRRADKRAAGVCLHCKELAQPGKPLCETHDAMRRARETVRRRASQLKAFRAHLDDVGPGCTCVRCSLYSLGLQDAS